MFTNDQLMGLLRQALPVIGTLLAALGWVTPDKWGALTAFILQAAGPGMVLLSLVWSMIANSKTSILKSAAGMDEVSKIVVSDSKLVTAVDRPEVASR